MNFTKSRAITLLILMAGCLSIHAQNYLVTTKSDTIRGDAKILTFGTIDQVQISVNKKKKTYTALEVRTLFLDNQFYKPMRRDNTVTFMKIVKSGYLSLYSFRYPNQVTYDGSFLAKMDGQSMEAPNLGFKKVMTRFLDDCDAVVSKLKSEELRRGDLLQIIDEYNTCIEKKTHDSVVESAQQGTANKKLDAVKKLQSKVEGLENLTSKKDILDLLTDISDKVSRQQTIANYQLEGLKSLLKDNESTKEELNEVITALSNN